MVFQCIIGVPCNCGLKSLDEKPVIKPERLYNQVLNVLSDIVKPLAAPGSETQQTASGNYNHKNSFHQTSCLLLNSFTHAAQNRSLIQWDGFIFKPIQF